MKLFLIALLLFPLELFGAGLTISTTNGYGLGLRSTNFSAYSSTTGQEVIRINGNNGFLNYVFTGEHAVEFDAFGQLFYGTNYGSAASVNFKDGKLLSTNGNSAPMLDWHDPMNLQGEAPQNSFTNVIAYSGYDTNGFTLSGGTGTNAVYNTHFFWTGSFYQADISSSYFIGETDSPTNVLQDANYSGDASKIGTNSTGVFTGYFLAANGDQLVATLDRTNAGTFHGDVVVDGDIRNNSTNAIRWVNTTNFITSSIIDTTCSNCTTISGANVGFVAARYVYSTNCVAQGSDYSTLTGVYQYSLDSATTVGGSAMMSFIVLASSNVVVSSGSASISSFDFNQCTNVLITQSGAADHLRTAGYLVNGLTIAMDKWSAADVYFQDVVNISITLGEGASIHGTIESTNNVTIIVPAYTHKELGTIDSSYYTGNGSGLSFTNGVVTNIFDAGAAAITLQDAGGTNWTVVGTHSP